jgi:hypothetical protein
VSLALIHLEMEGMDEDADSELEEMNEEIPEIPDTLFDTEISEEETEIYTN